MIDRRAEKVMKKGAITPFQSHSQNTFLNHSIKRGCSETLDHLSIVSALKNPLQNVREALRTSLWQRVLLFCIQETEQALGINS